MTDAPSIPPKLRFVGGSLHDWFNTGVIGILAALYIAKCEGIHFSNVFGLIWP